MCQDLREHHKKISTKKFDMQEYNEIMDNGRFLEELLLPRKQLLNRITRREGNS